jgi:hypothetical protein
MPDAGFVSPSGRSARGSHRLAAVGICEQLWYLKYHVGVDQLGDKAFRKRGTLIHLALAYYYAERMPEYLRPAWLEKPLREALAEKGAGMPDAIRCALEIYETYGINYAQEPWRPILVEEELTASVGEIDASPKPGADRTLDAELVTCRPDLIVAIAGLEGEAAWIVDHKSQGKPWGNRRGLEPWNPEGEFRLNWQVMVNLHIARAPSNRMRFGGLPVKGFIIQRMTREPDDRGAYHFDRQPLFVPPLAYAAAAHEIRDAVAHEYEVRRKLAEGIAPRKSFWACFGRYGACDYANLCGAASAEDQALTYQTDYVSL